MNKGKSKIESTDLTSHPNMMTGLGREGISSGPADQVPTSEEGQRERAVNKRHGQETKDEAEGKRNRGKGAGVFVLEGKDCLYTDRRQM